MATAGQAMVDDVSGEVTCQGLTGEDVRLPEPPFRGQERNRLHVGFDMHVVALCQEVVQAKAVAILKVHFIDLVPHTGTKHLWACDLPAPEVVEKITAHGAGTGIAMLHQWGQPLRIEVTGSQLYLQRSLKRIHPGISRVCVLEHPVLRWLAAQVLHGVGQPALEIKTVIVVQQAIEVAGPPKIGMVHRPQLSVESIVSRFTLAALAIDVPHAPAISVTQLLPVLPGARAGSKPVNPCTVCARSRTEDPVSGLCPRIPSRRTCGQQYPCISDPVGGNTVGRQGFLARLTHVDRQNR